MTQPEALRLADELEKDWNAFDPCFDAAKELRRLHKENQALAQHKQGNNGSDYPITESNTQLDKIVEQAIQGYASAKREWVGYTNEDRERIVPVLVQSLLNHDDKTMAVLLKAILIDIEQQLKEKNKC